MFRKFSFGYKISELSGCKKYGFQKKIRPDFFPGPRNYILKVK
jgi:hypothetical protein